MVVSSIFRPLTATRVSLFLLCIATSPLTHSSCAFSAKQSATSLHGSTMAASNSNLQAIPTMKENTNTDGDCIAKKLEPVIQESKSAFLEWARANMISLDDDKNDEALEAIAASCGNARVVALTEGCHNSREMMRLHSRLVRHLVEHHNFTTIVTETGLPESRIILDYVTGKDVELDHEQVYYKGLNQMYSAWEEGREMIEWIRDYNERESGQEQKVHYYGIDIGGFYRDWKTPMTQVLKYLQRYVYIPDKAFAIMDLTKRFKPFLDAMATDARKYYTDRMTKEERANLVVLFEDTVEIFTSMESEYVEKSGRKEYEWARQSLLSMQLAESYYRNFLERCNPSSSRFVGLNGREIAMHRNILWVLRQRPDSKIIWINHAVHTKTETQYQDELWGFFTPAGALLRESIGKDLFTVGLVYGGGQYWKDWQRGAKERSVANVPSPQEDGLESILGSLVGTDSLPMCFIPWSKAPVTAWPWLQSLTSVRENDYYLKLRPLEWQACLYIDKVHPATPAKTAWE